MLNYDHYEGLVAKWQTPESMKSFIAAIIAITESSINEHIGYIEKPVPNVPTFYIDDLNLRLGMEGITDPLNMLQAFEELWVHVFPDESLAKTAENARSAIGLAETLGEPDSKDVLQLVDAIAPLLFVIDQESLSALLLSTYCHIQSNRDVFVTRFNIVARSLARSEGDAVNQISAHLLTMALPPQKPFSEMATLSQYFDAAEHSHSAPLAVGAVIEGRYLMQDANGLNHRAIRITDAGCVLSIARGMWECIGDSSSLKFENIKNRPPVTSKPRQLAPAELPGFVPPIDEFEELWARAMLDDSDFDFEKDFE